VPAVRSDPIASSPTLPELLAGAPRRVRALALALAALVGVVVLVLALRPGPAVERTVVRGEVPFNVAIPAELERVAPARGEALALAAPAAAEVRQRFAVAPFTLPAYEGDVSAALMTRAAGDVPGLRASLEGFVLRAEGRTRINEQPGYQLLYQFTLDGRTAYGRRILLVAPEAVDPRPRTGARLDLVTQRSPAVPRVESLGGGGALKTPLRSFRLGEEAP
jgi:hypothetical protein